MVEELIEKFDRKYPMFMSFKRSTWNQNYSVDYIDTNDAVNSFIKSYPISYTDKFYTELKLILHDKDFIFLYSRESHLKNFDLCTGGATLPIKTIFKILHSRNSK